MSDEPSTPTSLRLKPRVRQAEPTTPSAPDAKPPSGDAASMGPATVAVDTPSVIPTNAQIQSSNPGSPSVPPAAPLKLRIKPQFAPETATPSAASSAESPAVKEAAAPSTPVPAIANSPTDNTAATPANPASKPVVSESSPFGNNPADKAPTKVAPPPVVLRRPPAVSGSTIPSAATAAAQVALNTPARPPVIESAAGAPPVEALGLKLKPKALGPAPVNLAAPGVNVANWPAPQPPPASTNPPLPGTPPPSRTIPPFPVVAPAPGETRTPFKLRTPTPPAEITPATPEHSLAFKIAVPVALAAAGIGLCVVGYFGWKYLKSDKAPVARVADAPKIAATPAAATPKPESPVPPKSEPPSAPPLKEVNLLAGAEEDLAKANSAQRVAAPSANVDPQTLTTSASAVTTVAPGVTTKTDIGLTNATASPEFRGFVANVKISGVFQGANPRALINGRMTRVGEIIDQKLGIAFDSIDAEKKQIIFKDASGALATRRY